MASVPVTGSSIEASKRPTETRWFSGSVIAVLVILGLNALYIAARVYQNVYGWAAGLDSTLPEFQTYWMNLLWAEIIAWPLVAMVLWGYLWQTRDRQLDRLAPAVELKRYFSLLAWFLVYTCAVYATAFFAEQDAAWHQTVVRDTSFTPSHIILFYGTIPLYFVIGMGAFLYAMTRLPRYAARISIPLAIAVGGPFLILPNLGYNEWGHAFWLVEETFGAPLHWGFVVLGWSGIALGGIFGQVLRRLTTLFPLVFGNEARNPAL